MSRKILLTVAALALGSAMAVADDRPDRPRIDTNGDGALDLAEIQAVRPNFTVEQFNSADKDGNGLLSRDEMRGFIRDMRDPPADTNGDGSISFEEAQARRPNLTPEQFAALDTDNSGGLSRAEIRTGMGRELFNRLDTDSSGGISLTELEQRMPNMTQERFDKLDSNHDGQLSQGELSSARPAHRGERRGPRGGEAGERRRPAGGGMGGRPRPPRTGG